MDTSTTTHPTGPTRVPPDEVSGPVAAAREIEIDAPVETVWQTLTDFGRWPEWNADVSEMSTASGDVVPGFVFRWKAGPGRITSTVIDVVAPRRIAWTGRTLGIRASHVWRIEPRGDRTLVHTEESFGGLTAQLFRFLLGGTLTSSLEAGLVQLAREVEGRSAGAGEG